MKAPIVLLFSALCGVALASSPMYQVTLPTVGLMNFTELPGRVAVSISWNTAHTCDGGLEYRIHNKWDHNTSNSTMCNPSHIGSWFDPTACSAHNQSSSSYNCTKSLLHTCAVGDLSGRHGNLVGLQGTVNYQDDVLLKDTLKDGRSIAVYCNGTKISCGSFVSKQNHNMVSQSPGGAVLQANHAGVMFTIGNNSMFLTINKTMISAVGYANLGLSNQAALDQCKFFFHIHTDWKLSGATGLGSTQCGLNNTGNHYDPLFACGPASEHNGQQQCMCNHSYGSGNNYTKCEVGDISCRFNAGSEGLLPLSNYKTWTGVYPMTTIPAGKSVVLHCGSTRIACARLQNSTSGPNPPPSPSAGPSSPPSPGAGPTPSASPSAGPTPSASPSAGPSSPPSPSAATPVVKLVQKFTGITSADLPNIEQDIATSYNVDKKNVNATIVSRHRRDTAITVEIRIQVASTAAADALKAKVEATPPTWTTTKAANTNMVADGTPSVTIVQPGPSPSPSASPSPPASSSPVLLVSWVAMYLMLL